MIIDMVELSNGYFVNSSKNRHGIMRITDEDIDSCFTDKRVDYSDQSFKDSEFWM